MDINPSIASKIRSLIDLTSLNDHDDLQTIAQLCQRSQHVAAVCVYPAFVADAKQQLANTTVKVATVANFPTGDQSLAVTLSQIKDAIAQGADEIDVVLPYQAFLSGDSETAAMFIAQCKENCGSHCLKVILETGAFPNQTLLTTACQLAIDNGADFLKTSTGKIPQGASLDAATTILNVIKASQRPDVGFKASGGIRSAEQAMAYLSLATAIMGEQWITPAHMRFGASSLLDDVEKYLT